MLLFLSSLCVWSTGTICAEVIIGVTWCRFELIGLMYSVINFLLSLLLTELFFALIKKPSWRKILCGVIHVSQISFFFFLEPSQTWHLVFAHHTTANSSTPTTQHTTSNTNTHKHTQHRHITLLLNTSPCPEQVQDHFITSGTRLAQEYLNCMKRAIRLQTNGPRPTHSGI